MKNKRILITGIAGSIGSELAHQLAHNNSIYGIDINETGLHDLITDLGISGRVGNIRDEQTVRDVFSDFKPQVVFHAAAYKHVPLMEREPIEAAQTNVIGTLMMLRYSKIYPVEKFVFISTDKAVNPQSIMGASKLMGEIATRNNGKGFIAVRFGNVMGSRGSVIPIWQRQIDRRLPLTVTDPQMERYMMTIPQACELVIEAAHTGKGGEIFVLDMGGRIKLLDLAHEIVEKTGHQAGIKVIGRRPGEQLVEQIMSKEEEARSIRQGKFFVIK